MKMFNFIRIGKENLCKQCFYSLVYNYWKSKKNPFFKCDVFKNSFTVFRKKCNFKKLYFNYKNEIFYACAIFTEVTHIFKQCYTYLVKSYT